MAFFRKRDAQVIRKGSADKVEVRKTRRIGGQKVEVRRITETTPADRRSSQDKKQQGRQRQRQDSSAKSGLDTTRRRRPPREDEIIIPPESLRKQMLVRVRSHQTQVVVLEGPQLVEHYVATAESESLVGNIYLGRVRNVLPGMEAAFVDFGAAKNGVVYASDVRTDDSARGKRKPR
ncbi:MAG: ribonuclease E/G, partial [Acidimicrobiia bacterium]